jgi:hypothetical protein
VASSYSTNGRNTRATYAADRLTYDTTDDGIFEPHHSDSLTVDKVAMLRNNPNDVLFGVIPHSEIGT